MPNEQNGSSRTYFSNRGQGVILVMQALQELGGPNPKNAVLRYIDECRYYDITRFDLPPYPGHNESRYHTLLAWARKDASLVGYLLDEGHDAWALNRVGTERVSKFRSQFETCRWDIMKSYLWTPKFKKLMCPSYEPSAADAVRPELLAEQYLDLI